MNQKKGKMLLSIAKKNEKNRVKGRVFWLKTLYVRLMDNKMRQNSINRS